MYSSETSQFDTDPKMVQNRTPQRFRELAFYNTPEIMTTDPPPPQCSETSQPGIETHQFLRELTGRKLDKQVRDLTPSFQTTRQLRPAPAHDTQEPPSPTRTQALKQLRDLTLSCAGHRCPKNSLQSSDIEIYPQAAQRPHSLIHRSAQRPSGHQSYT